MPDVPAIAAHILGHLAELEDKVEAEAALRAGGGGGVGRPRGRRSSRGCSKRTWRSPTWNLPERSWR